MKKLFLSSIAESLWELGWRCVWPGNGEWDKVLGKYGFGAVNWARTKAFLLQASGCQKKNCGERIWMSDLATSILDLRVFTEHIPSISYFVYFVLPILELGKVSG